MALYHHGLSRPPRTPRRRRILAWAVLVVSVALAVLGAVGAIGAWAAVDVGAALTFTLLTACCAIGVAAGTWALRDGRRREPVADERAGRSSRGD